MILKKIDLLLHTIKYLKLTQVNFRIYYLIRRKWRGIRGFYYPLSKSASPISLDLLPSIPSYISQEKGRFEFLNLTYSFDNDIDWNFSEFGKLWTYNLTYFDFLQQKGMRKEEGLRLINDFIAKADTHKDALEPFPIALRGINWIKFLTAHGIQDYNIDNSLYAQYYILLDNLEYHLLGNHLLENGFSLLFGAYYFHDERLYTKAQEILTSELTEQILDDGAHFELSPMYHQIMLFRVLDCINLLKNQKPWIDDSVSLLVMFEEKAKMMLGWLNTMTFENGDIPLFNDSAKNIAPTTFELEQYALSLELMPFSATDDSLSTIKDHLLSDSGYRKKKTEAYEIILDIGDIGPDYIPGHAHSDTFNFELYLHGQPFIVDTGTSTYETNARRTVERSTAAHNTVELDGLEQSEVWGGFRVANRAYVIESDESTGGIRAIHNGYLKRVGALHARTFLFEQNDITIIDTIISDRKHSAVARIHFHPDVDESLIRRHMSIDDKKYIIKDYYYAPEFNLKSIAKVLELDFTERLEVKIMI